MSRKFILTRSNAVMLFEKTETNEKQEFNRMKAFLGKTFGGLTLSYYLRHLFFGFLIFAFSAVMVGSHMPAQDRIIMGIFSVIWTFLYPYSRFVYESVMDFFMGDNIFILPIIILLPAKLFTMILCWSLSIFIAPVGLAWLYFHHSKENKKLQKEDIPAEMQSEK